LILRQRASSRAKREMSITERRNRQENCFSRLCGIMIPQLPPR
jgi:hypothetical protein